MDALAKSVSMVLFPQSSWKGRGLGEALPPGDTQTLTIPGILEGPPGGEPFKVYRTGGN